MSMIRVELLGGWHQSHSNHFKLFDLLNIIPLEYLRVKPNYVQKNLESEVT